MKVCVIDIGGTFIKASLMNEKSEILTKWKVPAPTKSMEEMMESLYTLIDEHKDEIEGIAISMPGKIDAVKGIAHTGGAYKFIKDMPIKDMLEEHYHLPVAVDNDGKCAANAENWVGALKDVENGLVFVIGTGIGGGVILGNKVYRGVNFSAGELSFAFVDTNVSYKDSGMICSKCATPGLLKMYKKHAQSEEDIDGIKFFELANAGDESAMAALHEFGSYFAKYIFNIQGVIDIEAVAVGGGISEQPLLFEVLQEEMDALFGSLCFLPIHEPKLLKCQYGNDANLIGAMKNFLDQQ
ncbi:MAG: ROK family protein [Firmicutes bacterium]|nr:ROK family protein [Bacillota bacterium]